ncbi:TolC family protein [Flagellimonas sp. CMM7]|uniref:TolC family protein n=1 Tax=Flagellimonas sp. CMM7 TaxID=2654676 RepID=UPI0013D61DE4|nr:TolC family protein [Flagellimonas sp. CMM7]UII78776.1 TolC family protein [Flagellimonas sp. CMM7]
MKKLLIIVIFIISSESIYSQKKIYNIGVLLDISTEEIQPIRDNLRKEIIAVVGEDATINFPPGSYLTNNYSLELAQRNYNQLLENEGIDIILAFGAINNIVISNQETYSKPTLLFGAVNIDLVDVNTNRENSGVENFTYLIQTVSYLQDLKKFKELTNFKKVGIVIEKEIAQVLPLKETFDHNLKELNASYKLIPYESIDDIGRNLNDVDAVYLAGGFFLNSKEVAELAQIFIENKLPSFTTTSKADVVNGLFATNQEDGQIDKLLRRIALSIESYVNGMSLSDLPVMLESNTRLTINYNTAEKVSVPIKYSLISSTDFVGDFVNSLSEKEYNLLTAIEQVLKKNLSLNSQEKKIALGQQDVKSANSNYLPNLSVSAGAFYVDPDLAAQSFGQNPEFSTSGNIGLNQIVFSEATNANISIQKKLLQAQIQNLNSAQLDAIFDVSNSYFNTLSSKANAQIQLRNLNLTKRNLQIAEENYAAGQSGKSDVLRFKSEMAQNTQALVEAVNQLDQGYVLLNQILNNPTETEIDIKDAELDKGVFQEYNYEELTEILDDPQLRETFTLFLIAEAKKNAPEIKSLEFSIEATERSERLYSNGRFLPTVSLQANYNRVFSRSGEGSSFVQPGFAQLDDYYNVGANVSIPIFNQNQNNINRQTAIIQKEQLTINKENFELNLSAAVRTNILSLLNQYSNIELSQVSEDAAADALDLTQTAYSNGSVTIIQLLDAQTNYLNAQLSRTTAVYNFLISALRLERALGYYFLLNSEEENTKFRQRFLEFRNNN